MPGKDTSITRVTERDPLLIRTIRERGRRGGLVVDVPINEKEHRIIAPQSVLDGAWADYLKKTGLG